MTSHHLPFENRWTSGGRAWTWHCELEHLGLANVRAMFAEHETHHGGEPAVIFDIPAGFVRDWLAFQDRRASRRQRAFGALLLGLCLVGIALALAGLLRP
ncbi:hypothetical protein JQ557_30195 [Bradyrhizobium sp. U87765 SZCCT0131]|uniref:hypothetical protein n=1 Tax=unclassified Bradyrhizobium TaxID=2631580 RepID=UPI001BA627ED|nr:MULTISPECIES: hypothetical protein [unclassified Bradyrhizobium]MBR1222306.1 hypothetical protein [Bradyrhizobium sp. U87765 SZCCT0131]MBR1264210.1 hypothetical protein [Bradyrhizobium sp. U87765 SZCCT0134]MBR1308007.1 hypothetical protein [Bradyrhizobium sp. U87765 SZCCT0110]MBR1320460.1 hypothetical protein [Bradyrhizobium sp. U87765 SZCCT0109]MBR1348427.1 hypothetical protein [Bradyrhizobium sp. U87765 SZCCT0048]